MILTRESESGTAEYLDDPERHRLLLPAEVVEILRLQPDMTVAELGSGQGRFTVSISEAVGPAGHVFAIETAPPMLTRFRERCQGQRNIHLVEAPHHETPLAGDSCDRVLMANLWAELPDPLATLREAARLLRENGRLILIEWRADAQGPPGPPPNARISFHEMVQLVEKNIWDIHRHGNAGPYSYFVEVAASDESVQS